MSNEIFDLIYKYLPYKQLKDLNIILYNYTLINLDELIKFKNSQYINIYINREIMRYLPIFNNVRRIQINTRFYKDEMFSYFKSLDEVKIEGDHLKLFFPNIYLNRFIIRVKNIDFYEHENKCNINYLSIITHNSYGNHLNFYRCNNVFIHKNTFNNRYINVFSLNEINSFIAPKLILDFDSNIKTNLLNMYNIASPFVKSKIFAKTCGYVENYHSNRNIKELYMLYNKKEFVYLPESIEKITLLFEYTDKDIDKKINIYSKYYESARICMRYRMDFINEIYNDNFF